MKRRTIAAIAVAITVFSVQAQTGDDDAHLINIFGKTATTAPDSTVQPKKTEQAAPPFLLFSNDDNAKLVSELRYDEAIRRLNDEIASLKHKKQSTDNAESLLRYAKNGQKYLKGTDHVQVIDSIVVSKKNLIDALNLNPELGSFFYRTNKDLALCYKTERGNKVYTSVPDSNGVLRLTVFNNDKQGLSLPTTLTGMDTDGDQNYPFMMSDGLTLYFSARSEDGLGNYDLYVTRLDEGTHFFKAENLGFPYNSYANDYLMVIDEANNIGMFASDRYQPANKVCLYFFLPNKSRQPYDYENEDHEFIRQASMLRNLAQTWQGKASASTKVAQHFLGLMPQTDGVQFFRRDFEFVVNDNTVCYSLDDFKKPQARQLAEQWVQKKKNLEDLEQQLDGLRCDYHAGNTQKRSELKNKILSLERQVPQLQTDIHETEKKIRLAMK